MQTFRRAVLLSLVVAIAGCATKAPPATQAPEVAQAPQAPAAAQAEPPLPPADWGPAFATAGARLSLEERGSTTVGGKRAMSYGFATAGYPGDKTYLLWLRMLTGKTMLLDRLRVDSAGALVTERGVPLAKETFNLYSLHRGEPVDFALVSQDQAVRTFARVVPFPLQARSNECTLTIEILEPGGRQFSVKAEGFGTNEDVVTTSTIDSRSTQQKLKASEKGRFVVIIDATQVARDGGTASYLAAGKRCKPKLSFDWGTALKQL